MRRTLIIAAGFICAAVAAVAASDALVERQADIIKIEVPAAKLAECEETLRQVAAQPAVADNGSPLLFGADNDLPSVRCVVEGAA